MKRVNLFWYVNYTLLTVIHLVDSPIDNLWYITGVLWFIATAIIILVLLPEPKPTIIEGKITPLGTVRVGNSYSCKLVPHNADHTEYLAGETIKGKLIKATDGSYEFHTVPIKEEKRNPIVHHLM